MAYRSKGRVTADGWLPAAAVLVGLLLCVTACSVDNPGPGIVIVNGTDQTVTVSYHFAASADTEGLGTLVSGDSLHDVSLFRLEGPCLKGSLVASAGSTEVDRLEKPCQGGRWEIGRPGEPSPGS